MTQHSVNSVQCLILADMKIQLQVLTLFVIVIFTHLFQ